MATILAKNEEDIIATNIEHHIEQGVSKFIVTDNNSTDRTKSIVEKYSEVVEIIDEPGDTHSQSEWVTRMSKIACKFKPDWIIHLDADELWCGLQSLKKIDEPIASCERMLLHPPVEQEFSLLNNRFYMNLDNLPIPQECKIAHKPDPTFVIEHGNHAVRGKIGKHTRDVYRHHYPVRSFEQWQRKAAGSLALKKRKSYCERWNRWYNLSQEGRLRESFILLCQSWLSYISRRNSESLLEMLHFWAEPEMIDFFKKHTEMLPDIGEWPNETWKRQNCPHQGLGKDRT